MASIEIHLLDRRPAEGQMIGDDLVIRHQGGSIRVENFEGEFPDLALLEGNNIYDIA